MEAIDHLVLTVDSVERTCEFYERVLGMSRESYGDGRIALHFGRQKINLHQVDRKIEPAAERRTPGSADLCFVTDSSANDTREHLVRCGVAILEGPIERTGARGKMTSIYFRDPDGNLVEVAHYPPVTRAGLSW